MADGGAFSFPFDPYPQQLQLMREINACITERQVGCLESPTGSGKTLSVLCAALTWLEEEERRILQEEDKEAESKLVETSGDWLEAILKKSSDTSRVDSSLKAKAKACHQRVQTLIANANIDKPSRRDQPHRPPKPVANAAALVDDDDLALDHYDSAEEQVREAESDSDEEVDVKQVLRLPQILYCSRTHSQLSQFVREIDKTRFRPRCVVLGSRKHCCIHPTVSRLSSEQLINDRCAEMAKVPKAGAPKKPRTGERCVFHDRHLETSLSFKISQGVHDLEDVVSMGAALSACPYFASKQAVAHSNVVCAPYSTVLHHDVRAACGLAINENTVVILDEAHNVVDAINHIYSAEVSGAVLGQALGAVTGYLGAYRSRFSGKNMYYLTLLMAVLKKLRDHVAAWRPPAEGVKAVAKVNDFLFQCGLDHINLFKLQRYISVAQLHAKVGGFADRMAAAAAAAGSSQGSAVPSGKGALRAALQLVFCLTNQDADGRLFFVPPEPSVEATAGATILKYVMLNPGRHFEGLLGGARAVLLLGGTLQPFSSLTDTLLASVPRDRLRLFACGHIVPREHIKPVVLGLSREGRSLELTHATRLSMGTTDALHTVLCDLASLVPAGLVVFFTSYQYLYTLLARWRSDGKLAALQAIKPVFTEANVQADLLDSSAPSTLSVWERYCLAVSHGGERGALLCSVMGGRLSEGINFSDDLARCVVVVGLPFADPRDLVLQEKLRFCQAQAQARGAAVGAAELSEALCMKTVNQAIGRAIRHARDHAAIVLLDQRYGAPRIHRLLPGWIRASMDAGLALPHDQAMAQLRAFFAARRAPSDSLQER